MENDILKSSYPNGNPKLECPIVDGKRNGLCILYYENGNICRKATFKDDLLDGVEETYHDNGMLRCKILFQQGRPVNKLISDVRILLLLINGLMKKGNLL